MGSRSEKAPTKRDENGDMENPVGWNVMQLAAEEVKHPTHKVMQQEAKPPSEVLLMEHVLTSVRGR